MSSLSLCEYPIKIESPEMLLTLEPVNHTRNTPSQSMAGSMAIENLICENHDQFFPHAYVSSIWFCMVQNTTGGEVKLLNHVKPPQKMFNKKWKKPGRPLYN